MFKCIIWRYGCHLFHILLSLMSLLRKTLKTMFIKNNIAIIDQTLYFSILKNTRAKWGKINVNAPITANITFKQNGDLFKLSSIITSFMNRVLLLTLPTKDIRPLNDTQCKTMSMIIHYIRVMCFSSDRSY